MTERIRERQKAGDFAGMASVIDDDLLAHSLTESTWTDAAGLLDERYAGVADRLVLYFAGMAWAEGPGAFEPWADVARALRTS